MTARGRRLLNVVVLVVGVALILVVASRAGSSSNGSSTNGSGPARDVPLFVRTTCADVVVLGLRGSGQSTTASKGVGNEVLASVSAMATQLHRRSDATVRLEAVPFPANYAPTLARYISHIKQGKKLMATRLTELSARCKDTSFAFVGFSQGANVVHNFSADLTAAQARRVAVVAMIADPVKNPADSIRTWSYSTKTPGPGKFGAGALMGKHVRDKAITFCVAKDEICNRPADGGPASPSSTHRHFYERATSARSAGKQLDAMLRRSGVG